MAQPYVSAVSPKDEWPVKELKGFECVFLQPGETKQFTLDLNARSFSYFDIKATVLVSRPLPAPVLRRREVLRPLRCHGRPRHKVYSGTAGVANSLKKTC